MHDCYPPPVSPRSHSMCWRLWKCLLPFLLLLLVRLFILPETLLTRVMHCLESISFYVMHSVWLGMPLGNFLYLGTNLSLDQPHHLRPIEAGLYFVGIPHEYASRVFLCHSGEYISMYQFFIKSLSPTSALYSWFPYLLLGDVYT